MYLEGLRILLAEDNHTNRVVAQQMLESIGASVAVAVDGAEALALLAEERFDVLLVDIEMPRVSGLEVIRRLSYGHPQRPDGFTIVALTAYATPGHCEEIIALGADGVITKPIVSIEQLGREVRGCIEASADREHASERSAKIDRDIYDGLVDAVGPAALKELLGKVDADIVHAYDLMTKALAGDDMCELRTATHNLVAVSGAIGAVGLQGLAERLNRAAHDGDVEAVRAFGDAASAEADRVLRFVCAERAG